MDLQQVCVRIYVGVKGTVYHSVVFHLLFYFVNPKVFSVQQTDDEGGGQFPEQSNVSTKNISQSLKLHKLRVGSG